MAYTINKTSGAVLTTVADGTLDNTTDITLIGKNYPGYGEILNENFVKLLENFASTAQPTSPIAGQLWWDSTSSVLKVFNGSDFKVISSTASGGTAPAGLKNVGDLWWDTGNGQLKAWNGSTWIIIGPDAPSGLGTSGAIVESVTDSSAVSHVIVSLYAANTRVAIVSKDQVFTPSPAISGFTTIRPGLNLASTGVIANNQYTGTVSDADQLDGLNSTSFMRTDANTSTSGTLAVSNNTGLTVGTSNDARISVASTNVTFENQSNGGNIRLRTRRSDGTQNTGVVLDSNGHFIPGTDNTFTLGASGSRWSVVHATTFSGIASSAQYADLAERYHADAAYTPGTVVKIGGEKEVTVADSNDEVFGVVSTNPAYLMNSAAGNDETHPAIALIGRVPVRVTGPVKKGQKIVVGSNGVAVAAAGSVAQDQLVGRALADKYDDAEGLIEVVLASH